MIPRNIPHILRLKVGTELFEGKNYQALCYSSNHTKQIVSKFGIPTKLILDNGPEFIDKVYRHLSNK